MADFSFGVQFLGMALVLGVMVFLAYFSLRLLGRARGGGNRSDKNMRIVEAIAVGPQISVQLVQVGEKYFAVGVSRTGITLLGEIDAEGLSLEGKTANDLPFEKYLSKFLPKKKDENNNSAQDKLDDN